MVCDRIAMYAVVYSSPADLVSAPVVAKVLVASELTTQVLLRVRGVIAKTESFPNTALHYATTENTLSNQRKNPAAPLCRAKSTLTTKKHVPSTRPCEKSH